MNAHLDESSMIELILGTNAEATQHADACATCRDEANRLRNTILGFRESIHAEAERNEIFWTKQCQTIRERRAAHVSMRLFPRIAVAALAMVLVLVSALLLLLRRPPSIQTAINEPPRQMSNDVADDELLQQVQNDVARDCPIALGPAVLISQERNSAISGVAATAPIHPNQKEQEP